MELRKPLGALKESSELIDVSAEGRTSHLPAGIRTAESNPMCSGTRFLDPCQTARQYADDI